MCRSIFKAYDIRGIADEQLGGEVPELIGRAFAQQMEENGRGKVAVGRDGRLSSPRIAKDLAKGLSQGGAEVFDIGLVPTPMLYEYALLHTSGSGIMVTGSHNPKEHNGLKMMIGGQPVVDEGVYRLYDHITQGFPPPAGKPTQVSACDFKREYISRIRDSITLKRPVKVVVDCGNGATGKVAPESLEAVGCEVIGLYTDIDGEFPNHHPDPADPENLKDCMHSLRETDAELAIAFDGDGDRLGVVSRDLGMIYPDLILLLYAEQVLRIKPAAKVVYDVKCTRLLRQWVESRGGTAIMSRTGHSFIKKLMREDEADIGGEMSGHFFFRDRWSGYDDAIYAAARLLELVSCEDHADRLFDRLPEIFASPEIKVDLSGIGISPAELVSRVAAELELPEGASLNTTDGLRIEFRNGFGLVRASNTTLSLVLRFEGDTREDLSEISEWFRQILQVLLGFPEISFPSQSRLITG